MLHVFFLLFANVYVQLENIAETEASIDKEIADTAQALDNLRKKEQKLSERCNT